MAEAEEKRAAGAAQGAGGGLPTRRRARGLLTDSGPAFRLWGALATLALGFAAWRIAGVGPPSAPSSQPRTPAEWILALEQAAAADPRPAEAYEGLGAACLRMGHVLSAREAFRRAQELGADSPWLRQQLAWCALRLDRRDEALRAYQALRDEAPRAPAGWLRLAGVALRLGEPETARQVLHAMPEEVRQALWKQGPDAREQLGRYLFLLDAVGEPAACLAVARRVMARWPQEVAGPAAAARSCLRLGRPHEALLFLERALRLAPARAELHALRGDALLALKVPERREEARAAYRRAVTLEPSLGPAQYRLGQLALAAGDGEEAMRAFAAARELGTEPVASLRGLARAAKLAGGSSPTGRSQEALWYEALYHETTGDTARARRLLERLLHDPRFGHEATLKLADLDARENRLRQAIARLEAAARQDPDAAAIQQALARAYRAFGRIGDATRTFERAAALDPALAPEVHRELAQIAESLADFDGAERHYAEAVRLRPQNATYRRLLGTLLLLRRQQGDRLARAIAELERAVTLAPEESAAFVALGHAYEAAGRDAEALLAMRHAIDLAPGAGAPYLDLGRLARRLGREAESREMLGMYRLYQQAQREIEALKAALSARPRDPLVRRALADYYFDARDFSRAAPEYERVLALEGGKLSAADRAAVRRRLAASYERLARREEAAAQLALAGR